MTVECTVRPYCFVFEKSSDQISVKPSENFLVSKNIACLQLLGDVFLVIDLGSCTIHTRFSCPDSNVGQGMSTHRPLELSGLRLKMRSVRV